jgi:hypothetical protein
MKSKEVFTFMFAYSGIILASEGIFKSHPTNTIKPRANTMMQMDFTINIILS